MVLWAIHVVAVRPVVAGPADVRDQLLRVQDVPQGALRHRQRLGGLGLAYS